MLSAKRQRFALAAVCALSLACLIILYRKRGEAEGATTLVTGYWNPDLMSTRKHTDAEYHEWIRRMVGSLRTPIVFYCDEAYVPTVLGYAKQNDFGLASRFRVVVHPMSNFSVARYREAITELNAVDPEREIYAPEYTMVMHEKAALLRRTQLENPFGSRFFLWVDAGIDREGFFPGHRAWPTNLAPLADDRVLVNNVYGAVSSETCPHPSPPPPRFDPNGVFLDGIVAHFAWPHIGIGGGIWGGSAAAVARLEPAYFQMLEAFLAQRRRVTSDQVILAALVCAHPSLMKPVSLRNGWWSVRHLFRGAPTVWLFLLDYLD